MTHTIRELQAQYVTDEEGKKTAVILPIEEFEELLERRDELTIPFDEVVAKLKRDGILPD